MSPATSLPRGTTPALQWAFPYASTKKPVLAASMVVASQPLAAQAGLAMLAQGGNAVDAAIGAAAVLAVVEPTNNSIGGDAFAQVWHHGRLYGINGSGRSPSGWTLERFAGRDAVPTRGWDSVTVPGAVSVWAALAERFARLEFARLLEPAIRYAREGFLVSPGVAEKWREQGPALAKQPGFAEAFLPGGCTPAPGARFRLPALAETLERIAATRGEDFYRGETAAMIARFAREGGAALGIDDLAAHQPDWVDPIAFEFRGLQVHEMPPNGQGIVALMALGMLEHLDLGAYAPDSAPWIHLQIEALKLAFADAARHVADPGHMRISVEALLDPTYLAARAASIDPKRAQDFGPGAPPLAGTVYLAAADAEGSVVSLIQSNYMGFGSGVVVPQAGVSLQNRGAGFTLEPGHPNRIAPRKRPYHTILPGFVTLGGAPLLGLGSTGGAYQPQGHVQALVRLAMHGQNPQAVVDAPRFRVGAARSVNFEPGFKPAVLGELEAMGHAVHAQLESSWDFGGMQIIYRLAEGWLGACDARRDSLVAGA